MIKIKTTFWDNSKFDIIQKFSSFFFFMGFVFLGQLTYIVIWNLDKILISINLMMMLFMYILGSSSEKWLKEKENTN